MESLEENPFEQSMIVAKSPKYNNSIRSIAGGWRIIVNGFWNKYNDQINIWRAPTALQINVGGC